MKLIFLTDVFPYPPHHGSSVVSYNLIRCLSEGHKVSLLSCNLTGNLAPDDHAREHLQEMGVSLVGVLTERRHLLRMMGGLLGRMPLAFSRIPVVQLRRILAREVEAHLADVAILIGPAMASLLVHGPLPIPIIFMPYDSVSRQLASRLPYVRNPIRRAVWWLEGRKWAFVENHVYPQSSACVAVTNSDAQAIARRWEGSRRAKIHVIPIGVDTAYFSPQGVDKRANHLVVTGNMWATESVSSLLWFLRNVLPVVQATVPNVTLDIVGHNPARVLQRATARIKGVRVVGSVPDVRPYIAEATVYVCPLLLGSGMKIRLLEAMAMGKAIVATSLCCEGLQVNPGQDLLVANGEQPFAEAIISLLNDSTLRQRLGHAARQAILASYSWEVAANSVEHLLKELVTVEECSIES